METNETKFMFRMQSLETSYNNVAERYTHCQQLGNGPAQGSKGRKFFHM